MDANTRAAKYLHESGEDFGKAERYFKKNSFKYLLSIPNAIENSMKYEKISSVLDYGTGQGGLIEALSYLAEDNIKVSGYDPAVTKYKNIPSQPYDLITCIDVLEHLSHKSMGSSLDLIAKLTNKFFFFCIDLVPSSKKLPDKRNAHTLIATPDWWCQQIKTRFLISSFIEAGHLPDGSRYPKHLFGCATNSMNYFQAMNAFIEKVEIANVRTVWTSEGMLGTAKY